MSHRKDANKCKYLHVVVFCPHFTCFTWVSKCTGWEIPTLIPFPNKLFSLTDKTCPDNCSGQGTCDSSTGTCTCNSGYTGANCAGKKKFCNVIFSYPGSRLVNWAVIWSVQPSYSSKLLDKQAVS